jgi:hypothetical protein
MRKNHPHLLVAAVLVCILGLAAALAQRGQNQRANHDLGFEDTPMLPGQPWHVHDDRRPHPALVTPAADPGGPPSDAVILFDGKDLSAWTGQASSITHAGKEGAPEWKIENGYFEVVPHTGDLATKEKFGDCQLHVEWSEPTDIKGRSQSRGNSGVILMGHYEIQVLDPWKNPTYADGQAGAIYGQWPPLVNPGRPDGEWQVYDIIFEAPKFDGDKVAKPAYVTVIFNGVVVHHHKEIMGAMVYRQVAHYTAHPPEEPLVLQNHNSPVRYRNIWIRRLGNYDQPEKNSTAHR